MTCTFNYKKLCLYTFLPFALFITVKTVSQSPIITATRSHDTVLVTFTSDKTDYLYKDFLEFLLVKVSDATPEAEITELTTQAPVEMIYDPAFQEVQQAYMLPFSCTISIKSPDFMQDNELALQITYYTRNQGSIAHVMVPLLGGGSDTESESYGKPDLLPEDRGYSDQGSVGVALDTTNAVEEASGTVSTKARPSWAVYIGSLVKTTQSSWARIVLALLLGLLVSFTPCIYPMIPITIGILQAQKQSSLINNFLVSLAYVMGIALTFACLGLLAAYTGQLFGTLVTHPVVILLIVACMIYLAGSMFGFYEMYIPRSLQNNRSMSRRGSLISAFIFGALSGTVASPCLSPGLLLLLTVVSTLGNPLIGLAMLFAFGLGLGLPLLIIGTFSGSLSMMPRAGMWMEEIKKVFGLLLLAVCFYFLSPLVNHVALYACFSLFAAGVGIFYLYDASNGYSLWGRVFKTIFGLGTIIIACVMGVQVVKLYLMGSPEQAAERQGIWITDYARALEIARTTNKKLFVCFSSPACTLCKKIEAKMFTHPRVCESLEPCITVKLDGSDQSDALCCKLQQEHKIMGFPSYLLLDQDSGQLIKQWGGELYEVEHEDFIEDLKECFGAIPSQSDQRREDYAIPESY